MGETTETPQDGPPTTSRHTAEQRPVDQPPQKVRRSRAELSELMLDGGVAVLAQTGIEAQISSVTYVRVFEHIERTTGIKVTYGSVHERIWDSVAHYQLAVIERAGVFDRADPAAAVDHDAETGTDETGTDEAGTDEAATDEAWGAWLTAAVALVSGPDDDPLTEAARAAIGGAYPAPTRTDDPHEVLAVLATAVADGLALRRHLTGEPLPTVTVPTGPGGSPQQWQLSDLARWAMSQTLSRGETATEG
jgi:hypothetical protein